MARLNEAVKISAIVIRIQKAVGLILLSLCQVALMTLSTSSPEVNESSPALLAAVQ
jgi:hypothetical protein